VLQTGAVSIEPDTKDWTWVLSRPCPECGFDPADIAVEELPDRMARNAEGWSEALLDPGATARPAPQVWSPLEYACHIRDVHRIFAERLRLMLDQDDPQFANWDQDATAVESRYDEQDPATVSVELTQAAAAVAQIYSAVTGDQWHRPGRRSNGSVFTVETLGVYHLHDVVHHLHDIGRGSGTA
jgi:DinB superfamily